MNPIPGKCFRCGKKIEIGYTLCPKCASMLGAENRPTSFMTREDVIANLKMIRVAFVLPVTKEQRKLIDDTFEMAIKALEQETDDDDFQKDMDDAWEQANKEPCEDAISRLDKIRQIIAIPNSVIQEDVIKYKMICEVMNDDKSVF